MIYLKPFIPDDYDFLNSWISNEHELIQFSGGIFQYPIDREQIKEYLNDSVRYSFKVIFTESYDNGLLNTQIIGMAEIYRENNETAKLCRVLIGHPDMRDKGLGKKIIRLLLNKAFDDMACEYVHLNVYDWNVGAIKCYEQVGFVKNPLINQHVMVDGKQWTTINMSIDKCRWKSVIYE